MIFRGQSFTPGDFHFGVRACVSVYYTLTPALNTELKMTHYHHRRVVKCDVIKNLFFKFLFFFLSLCYEPGQYNTELL